MKWKDRAASQGEVIDLGLPPKVWDVNLPLPEDFEVSSITNIRQLPRSEVIYNVDYY